MNNNNHPKFSLESLRNGDQMEFSRMVDAYSGMIYRLAIKMMGNPQDAEDILQITFMKAHQNIKQFEGRSSLSTWLYRIATNEALMQIRKQHPEITGTDPDSDTADDDHAPMQITDWCCLPENELLSTESRIFLDKAIHNLPETLRIVFILRDIEGLSIQETSRILQITETNVKTRLLRARLNLREQLTSYFGERIPGRRN